MTTRINICDYEMLVNKQRWQVSGHSLNGNDYESALKNLQKILKEVYTDTPVEIINFKLKRIINPHI